MKGVSKTSSRANTVFSTSFFSKDTSSQPSNNTNATASVYSPVPFGRDSKKIKSQTKKKKKKITIEPNRSNSVQEGYLKKRRNKNFMWKKRYFSIINDTLFYFKSEDVS